MQKVALIYGGRGAEAEVSKVTVKAFAKALEELGEEFVQIEADEDLPVKLKQLNPKLALLAVHGKYSEDGTLQGLCEYLKIPYTGSGVLASALSFDKVYCKNLFEKNNIPTAKFQSLDLHQQEISKFTLELSFPVVVKPSREGSSIGVSIVNNQQELVSALKLAAQYDNNILIEKFIEGKEVTIPILKGKTLESVEIAPKQGFYNYENKYQAGKTNYILPANVEKRTLERLKEITIEACQLLKVRSYARVDFMLDKNENPYIMEVNTLPGCTPTSLVPKAAAHAGIEFKEFIRQIMEEATLDYEGLK
ncbi:MAG: D-alanine--D-alanine ligase [Bdellovibrionales bacterium]|nr:D-alanine--D-alanine ligase [Bdellovibrionales bacterium]